ncbi:heterokaryon incompatibility protein-domain-containing protein [Stachybotrys elegans]|uniref:Heterokaryon incompatibility protein-domain-containing protein n=1 Tax=Stachybotrys elegans TaxID=80388 RepID=A0A8K0SVI6_9HYPO|nr:heterokaryon incompatibility protein-domain-containing protein [Stachybotrys elegans]
MAKIYSDLKDPLQIRCLTLTHGEPGDQLCAQLQTLSLASNPEYDALSYVWGTESAASPMTIDGESFTITKNLDIALRHLRHCKSDRTLWVDAICINQSDIPEREAQVKLMDRIYRSARTVLVWLGASEDDSDETMRSIQKFARHQWQTYEFQLGFMNILFRPWFTRIWVLQEFLLGKSPRIGCGNIWIPWVSFLYAWSEFRFHDGPIDAKFNVELSKAVAATFEPGWSAPPLNNTITFSPAMRYDMVRYITDTFKPHELATIGFQNTSELLQNIQDAPAEWLGRYLVLQEHRYETPLARTFWRKDQLRTVIPLNYYEFLWGSRGTLLNRKSLTLGSIIKGTMNLRSTDARDKIYGVLGLLSDAAREAIPVNYEKGPEWTFVPTMEFIVKHEPEAISLLGLLWRTRRPFEIPFPSWVPDFTISADWDDSHSPVFLRGSCANALWKWPREMEVSHDHTAFSASGLSFGKIQHLVQFNDGDIESYIAQFRDIESLVSQYCPLSEPLWRTLVGVRNTAPEFDQDEPFSQQFRTRMNLPDNPGESMASIASAHAMFATMIRDIVRGRVFFTTDEGFAGIATPDIKMNDAVGLIFGMERAAVLRIVQPAEVGIRTVLEGQGVQFHRVAAFAYVGCHDRRGFKTLEKDGLTDWTQHCCFHDRTVTKFHII